MFQSLSAETAKSILLEGSTPLIFNEGESKVKLMEDPFTGLGPCHTFNDMEWQSMFVPIEGILSELESKLADYMKEKEEKKELCISFGVTDLEWLLFRYLAHRSEKPTFELRKLSGQLSLRRLPMHTGTFARWRKF
jgi:hypothetical protein